MSDGYTRQEQGLVLLIEPLSAREQEILELVAEGQTGPQIAVELFIAHSTVRTHVHNLMSKMGVHNRVAAVVLGTQLGLLVENDKMTPIATALLALIMAHPAAYAEVLASGLLSNIEDREDPT